MNLQSLTYQIDGNIGIITLNRPEDYNVLGLNLLEELNWLIKKINADPSVIVAILTGAEKTFSAGADLKGLIALTQEEKLQFNRKIIETFNLIEKSPIPFIAAINGHMFGGGMEMALSCSIRMISSEARIGLPEVKLGILPGAGGTQRLPRLIGRSKALQLLLTGDTMTAQEALEYGIVDQVVPLSELHETSMALAKRIAQNAPLAVKAIKDSVTVGIELTVEQGISYTERHLDVLSRSNDSVEGIQAFLEKRKPNFTGS